MLDLAFTQKMVILFLRLHFFVFDWANVIHQSLLSLYFDYFAMTNSLLGLSKEMLNFKIIMYENTESFNSVNMFQKFIKSDRGNRHNGKCSAGTYTPTL